jgi:hypothetical protein
MTGKDLRQRVFSHVLLKAVGSTAAIWVFFIFYFRVMEQPFFPVNTMPVYWLDHQMPVLEWSAWVYFSLWVYICLPNTLMHTVPALGQYLLGAFVLAVCGLSVFTLYPTAVPHWEVDWSLYPTLEFLKSKDVAGNACPSMHVAFSVFAGFWLHEMLKKVNAGTLWKLGNVLWGLAIILSTLTTRQHVWIDVFWGAPLGMVVFYLNFWWVRRCETRL